jgi:hypothetical protein
MFYEESFVTETREDIVEDVREAMNIEDALLGRMLEDKEVVTLINKAIATIDEDSILKTAYYPTFQGAKEIVGYPLVPMFPYAEFLEDEDFEQKTAEDKSALIAAIAFSICGIQIEESFFVRRIVDEHDCGDLFAMLGHYILPLMAEYVEKKINAPQGSLFFVLTGSCIGLGAYPEVNQLF